MAGMAKSADVIVVAVSQGTADSPGFWSGYVPATRQVVYVPEQWLKGTLQTSPLKIGTFTVEHLVVRGTATADDNEPKLNESLFAKGNKLILFLHTRTLRLPDQSTELVTDAVSAECGVIAVSPANLDQVKAALNTSKSSLRTR